MQYLPYVRNKIRVGEDEVECSRASGDGSVGICGGAASCIAERKGCEKPKTSQFFYFHLYIKNRTFYSDIYFFFTRFYLETILLRL